VTKIGGQPVQKEGIYRVAMNTGMLLGLDDVQPLIQYVHDVIDRGLIVYVHVQRTITLYCCCHIL